MNLIGANLELAIGEGPSTTSAGEIAGTISAIEGSDSSDFAGIVLVSGAVTVLEDSDEVAASGLILVSGSFASSEPADTASFDGSISEPITEVSGVIAVTDGPDSLQFNGNASKIPQASSVGGLLSPIPRAKPPVVGAIVSGQGRQTVSAKLSTLVEISVISTSHGMNTDSQAGLTAGAVIYARQHQVVKSSGAASMTGNIRSIQSVTELGLTFEVHVPLEVKTGGDEYITPSYEGDIEFPEPFFESGLKNAA